MLKNRPVKLKLQRQPVTEGAGVRLNRLFGHAEAPALDPFLLLSGRPLNEPVAWRGPIVMNTKEELETAFREYREGGFIKTG